MGSAEIDFSALFDPMRWSGKSSDTLEQRLVTMGVDLVLPQRRAQDISRLDTFLDRLIFAGRELRKPEDAANDGLNGPRILVTSQRLAQALGTDYEQTYSPRDWSAAMEAVLERHNDPVNPIRFGDDYRMNFNSDGTGGVMVIVLNEQLLPRSAGSVRKLPSLSTSVALRAS